MKPVNLIKVCKNVIFGFLTEVEHQLSLAIFITNIIGHGFETCPSTFNEWRTCQAKFFFHFSSKDGHGLLTVVGQILEGYVVIKWMSGQSAIPKHFVLWHQGYTLRTSIIKNSY